MQGPKEFLTKLQDPMPAPADCGRDRICGRANLDVCLREKQIAGEAGENEAEVTWPFSTVSSCHQDFDGFLLDSIPISQAEVIEEGAGSCGCGPFSVGCFQEIGRCEESLKAQRTGQSCCDLFFASKP